METAKYLLIVTAPLGVIIRDMPGAESEGAKKLRTERRGNKIMCARIIEINGVPYGEVINPSKPNANEWVRVAEADNNTKYVEVIDLSTSGNSADSSLVAAIKELTAVLEKIATN